jgi:hypothetical protein
VPAGSDGCAALSSALDTDAALATSVAVRGDALLRSAGRRCAVLSSALNTDAALAQSLVLASLVRACAAFVSVSSAGGQRRLRRAVGGGRQASPGGA